MSLKLAWDIRLVIISNMSATKLKSHLPKAHVVKRNFKIFININYISGFLYAFFFFVTTSRGTEMFTRRLWAYECWLILSFYGLFIYLFYLEKSALENERGLFRFMKIQADTLIKAPAEELLDWFAQISQHPDKYSFDSHLGVAVISGTLTESGSIFETKEKFLGIFFRLRFETTKIDEQSGFEFKLLSPVLSWLNFGGAFIFKSLDENITRLELVVFNHPTNFVTRIISGLIYLSPVRAAIARQISKEVKFIARQVEQ